MRTDTILVSRSFFICQTVDYLDYVVKHGHIVLRSGPPEDRRRSESMNRQDLRGDLEDVGLVLKNWGGIGLGLLGIWIFVQFVKWSL